MLRRGFLVWKRKDPIVIIHAQERREFESKSLTPE
jgi:hypothetical protein